MFLEVVWLERVNSKEPHSSLIVLICVTEVSGGNFNFKLGRQSNGCATDID